MKHIPARVWPLWITLVVALAGTAVVHAGPFEDADSAYGRGDFATALALLAPLVDKGDARAQLLVARILWKGESGGSGGSDSVRALELTRLAANQGHARAQYSLARAYRDGRGVAVDLPASVQWLRRAAEQGDADAQNELGLALVLGKGVARDPTEAMRWWRTATDQGHAAAPLNMGASYIDGTGVPQSDIEAARWFRLSAERGYARGALSWAMMLDQGRGVRRDEVQAMSWLRRSAEGDEPLAQVQLAARYHQGVGVPRDMDAALKWAARAADSGNAQGQVSYGSLLLESDHVQGYGWLWLAAEQGEQLAWAVLPRLRDELGASRLALAREAVSALRARLGAAGRPFGPLRERDTVMTGVWRGESSPEGEKPRRWTMVRDPDGWFQLQLEVGAPGSGSDRQSGLWWTDGGFASFAYGGNTENPETYRYTLGTAGCMLLEQVDSTTRQPGKQRYRFEDCRSALGP